MRPSPEHFCAGALRVNINGSEIVRNRSALSVRCRRAYIQGTLNLPSTAATATVDNATIQSEPPVLSTKTNTIVSGTIVQILAILGCRCNHAAAVARREVLKSILVKLYVSAEENVISLKRNSHSKAVSSNLYWPVGAREKESIASHNPEACDGASDSWVGIDRAG